MSRFGSERVSFQGGDETSVISGITIDSALVGGLSTAGSTTFSKPVSRPSDLSVGRMSSKIDELSINKLRFGSAGLFGRDDEIKILRDTFAEVVSKNEGKKRGLVFLSGASGVGKTALASAVRNDVHRAKGFFVSGKFDLNQRNEPYAGIKKAIDELSDRLESLPSTAMTETTDSQVSDDHSIETFQSQIMDDLQSELPILMEFVPSLKRVFPPDKVKESSLIGDIDFKESADRLKYVIRKFFQVVADFCPLVLVVDDCQWADKASMGLMESLVTDPDVSRLLVIGCYREDEVDGEHMLFKLMRDVKALVDKEKIDLVFKEIQVNNMTADHINDMLAELLTSDQLETADLADVVFRKTLGNCFFVVQFLIALTNAQLLTYSFGSMRWVWDTATISKETSATDNVASLMEETLKKNEVARAILPVAACLGYIFDGETLELVLTGMANPNGESIKKKDEEKTSEQTAVSDDFSKRVVPGYDMVHSQLEECVGAGLLDKVGYVAYRFVHDKVQETALRLIPESELDDLKFKIGTVLLKHFSTGEEEHVLFTMVNLLNVKSDSIAQDDPVFVKMLEFNLLAGKKAMECSAFEAASMYFHKLDQLLPENRWEMYRDISLECHALAASAEYCNANYEEMHRFCDHVVTQKRIPILDKVSVYHTLMDASLAVEDQARAVSYGLDVLQQFGCSFPKRSAGVGSKTVLGLIKAKMGMRPKSVQLVESLPIVSDENELAVMKTLDKFSTATFVGKPELLPLAIFEMSRRTSKEGITPYSAIADALLGIVFCGILNDFVGGKVCGERALAILKRCPARGVMSRCVFLVNAYITHWSSPLQDCMKPLMNGYDTGMKTGDLESATWCLFFYLESALFVGRTLADISSDLESYTKQMEQYKQMKQLRSSNLLWQAIMNFRGESDTTTELIGKAYDENEALAFFLERKDEVMEAKLRSIQMFVCAIFADHEKGAMLEKTWGDKAVTLLPGQASCVEVRFANALSCFAMARSTGKKKYKARALKSAAIVKKWYKSGNVNCIFHDSLLDAEKSALRKDTMNASKLYESAIHLAGRRGLRQNQALASERFGEYMLEVGNEEEAQYRLSQAIKIYTEWGATKKAEQMETKYRDLLPSTLMTIEIPQSSS